MNGAELDLRQQWLVELIAAPQQDPLVAEVIVESLAICPTAALQAWCGLDQALRMPFAESLLRRWEAESEREFRIVYALALARLGPDARSHAPALEAAADQPTADAEQLVALFALLSLDPTNARGVARLLTEACIGRPVDAGDSSFVIQAFGPMFWRHLPTVSAVVFDAIEANLLHDRDGGNARALAVAVAHAHPPRALAIVATLQADATARRLAGAEHGAKALDVVATSILAGALSGLDADARPPAQAAVTAGLRASLASGRAGREAAAWARALLVTQAPDADRLAATTMEFARRNVDNQQDVALEIVERLLEQVRTMSIEVRAWLAQTIEPEVLDRIAATPAWPDALDVVSSCEAGILYTPPRDERWEHAPRRTGALQFLDYEARAATWC